MSPKSEREEFCRSRFDAYLQQRNVSERIEWQEGPEPPDYYLAVGDQRFAVEVTTISDKIDVGSGKEIEREKLVEYRKRLVSEVEGEARKEGILRGSYHVKFAPLLPPQFDLDRHRRQIKRRLLLYIEKTQDESAHPEQTVEIKGKPYCTIHKVSFLPPQIRVPWEPWTGCWEADALSKACEWLQLAMRRKAGRLKGADERLGIELPKVLLILHDFDAVDFTTYEHFVSRLEDLMDYHTIAIVSAFKGQGIFILHTADETWKS